MGVYYNPGCGCTGDEPLPTVERVPWDDALARLKAIGENPPEHPKVPGYFASRVDYRPTSGTETHPMFGFPMTIVLAEITIYYAKPETWRDREPML
jgi:hypothetical protein